METTVGKQSGFKLLGYRSDLPPLLVLGIELLAWLRLGSHFSPGLCVSSSMRLSAPVTSLFLLRFCFSGPVTDWNTVSSFVPGYPLYCFRGIG